jgi:hypothetical protein
MLTSLAVDLAYYATEVGYSKIVAFEQAKTKTATCVLIKYDVNG